MRHTIYILFFIILFPFAISAQLQFNEIMVRNISAHMDGSYNYSQWVEIYNNSAKESVYLSSFYITDNINQPFKWTPPFTPLHPGGYAVVYLENQFYNSNFKLDPAGGSLYLYNSLGKLIDQVNYPPAFRNIAFGRKSEESQEWIHLESATPKNSNTTSSEIYSMCRTPYLNKDGGFYDRTKLLKFDPVSEGETIYYTLDGSEPTTESIAYDPNAVITISSTTTLRARCCGKGMVPSDIVTATYFINERIPNLPVVSITVDPIYLYDDMMGIHVVGKNGITGKGSDVPVNWNRDWARPANFELFDRNNHTCLNQELDLSISGGASRIFDQKSFKIAPRKKYGNTQLRYDLFASTKPNHKYKNITLRNSGNDFVSTHLRDAYMHSLIAGQLDIDYMAYEPMVVYVNGEYWGIMNMREKAAKDYTFSNYGLDSDEVVMFEDINIHNSSAYAQLRDYITKNDVALEEVYERVGEMMDIDNFINTWIAEIYYCNTDWPINNTIIWKKINGGKWRWLFYDLDFGLALVKDYTHNTLKFALEEGDHNLLFRRLTLNEAFNQKFLDRFCVQMASTFEYERSMWMLDSLKNRIADEIPYHKERWNLSNNWEEELCKLKIFLAARPASMLCMLGEYFCNTSAVLQLEVESNISDAFFLFNGEPLKKSDFQLGYFSGKNIRLEAKAPLGYRFKGWKKSDVILPYGSEWRYFTGEVIPAPAWYNTNYYDNSWKKGQAPLGYNVGGVSTIIPSGNEQKKYSTAYFRNSFRMEETTQVKRASVNILVNDGAVVYFNAQEVGRVNIPIGLHSYDTPASEKRGMVRASFNIPIELINKGRNTLAVEVHQHLEGMEDMIFDAQVMIEGLSDEWITTTFYESEINSSLKLQAVFEPWDGESQLEPWEMIRINEVVASNSLVQDEFGDTEDYFELYNMSDEHVDIGGWYLSDKTGFPKAFKISENHPELTTIEPNGFLVFWADSNPDKGVFHTNFGLSKDGENVILSTTDKIGNLVMIDEVRFPSLPKDQSYSRVPDGIGNWLIQNMTFNQTNGNLPSHTDNGMLDKVKIYPTLVEDRLIIEGGTGEMITIWDIWGNVVYQRRCESEAKIIFLGYLQVGSYLMRVGENFHKIIKQ